MLSHEQQQALLALARNSIRYVFDKHQFNIPDDSVFHEKKGLFVTLHKRGRLRGCIGYIYGFKEIAANVMEMAKAAAFRDPRFPPVTAKELDDISIEISVLSEMIPVKDVAEIEISRDGLMLEHPYGSGLLLPQVAVEWQWDRDTFLKQLCHKAGLPESSWHDKNAKLYRFSAEIFSEESKNSD